MAKSSTTSPGYMPEELTDHDIESLLAIGSEMSCRLAIIHICRLKKGMLWDRIVGWNRTRNWRLSTEELGDVWDETMLSVIERSLSGQFQVRGILDGFLSTVAFRRGIDQLQKSRRDQRGMPNMDVFLISGPPLDEVLMDKDEVRYRFQRLADQTFWNVLSDGERRVIHHLIYYLSVYEVLPTNRQLSDYINECCPQSKTTATSVKSAKQRAFKKFRNHEE